MVPVLLPVPVLVVLVLLNPPPRPVWPPVPEEWLAPLPLGPELKVLVPLCPVPPHEAVAITMAVTYARTAQKYRIGAD
jgi:hypothetical protein